MPDEREHGAHRVQNMARGRAPGPTGITLAGIPVPREDETKHFKLIGTTGTGKSTAIRELLRAALARGDRAVIADPDGGYLRRFYDSSRGDVILNPFDPASARWDLYGEITNDYDVEQLARSLIPDHEGPERAGAAMRAPSSARLPRRHARPESGTLASCTGCWCGRHHGAQNPGRGYTRPAFPRRAQRTHV